MYYDVLKYSWSEMAVSNYFYKSNSRRRVIEMNGSECPDSVMDTSAIVIMYNVVSGCPLILTEKFYEPLTKPIMDNLSEIVRDKFNVNIETGEDKNGSFTEIVCIRKSFYNSVVECDFSE